MEKYIVKQKIRGGLYGLLPCMLLLMAGAVFADLADVCFISRTNDRITRMTAAGVVVWHSGDILGADHYGLEIGPDGNVYAATTDGNVRPFYGATEGAAIGGTPLPTPIVAVETTVISVPSTLGYNDIVFSPDGDLYVATRIAATPILRFTKASGYLVGSILPVPAFVGPQCYAIDFGPDANNDGRKDIYAVDQRGTAGTSRMKVIDAMTGALITTWGNALLDNYVDDIFCGSDGRVYVVGTNSDSIASYKGDGTDRIVVVTGAANGVNDPRGFCEAEPGTWYVGNKAAVTGSSNGTVTKFTNNFAIYNGIFFNPNPPVTTAEFTGVCSFYKGTAARGAAHNQQPTGTSVDPGVTSSVSWYSPEQDANGAVKDDPNIVAVTGYDVYWSVVDANFVGESPASSNQALQSFTPPALTYSTTYYWRVDAYVTWDSAEVTGKLNDVIPGAAWQFTTRPSYVAPTLTYNNVIYAMDLFPTKPILSATVTGNSHPMNAPVFTLLTGDAEFPVGAVASVANTTTDVQNPTATLTTNMPGTYKVKLVVNDGFTTIEALAAVKVYTDDCQAKKDAGGWVANYYDTDSDCHVTLTDFAALAVQWLNNTTLAAQVPLAGLAGYVPLAVFDARTEAEWVDLADPNACSEGPIGDTVGIRIQPQPNASNLNALGYATANAWVEYTIDVPAAKVGVPVDVYLGYSLNTGTTTLSFGTAAAPDAYGTTMPLAATGNWTTFVKGVKVGTVTFTAAGPQKVRTTYAGGLNLDWFSFAF